MADELVERDDAGRWITPPKSPGRPKGPTEAERIREHLLPKKVAVLEKLASLAEMGDPKSMQLFLAYIAPPARPEDEKVSIPGFAGAPTLREKAEAVILAAAQGQCSASAAERLLRVLDIYSRAAMADEFEARLRALEGKQPSAPATLQATADDITDIDNLV